MVSGKKTCNQQLVFTVGSLESKIKPIANTGKAVGAFIRRRQLPQRPARNGLSFPLTDGAVLQARNNQQPYMALN